MTYDDGISFPRKEEGSETKNSGKKRSREISFDSSLRRRKRESYRKPSEIIIKIISASYGPCEYNCFDDSEESPIPSTRDCTSFLLDLLSASQRTEGTEIRGEDELTDDRIRREQQNRDKCNGIIRLPPTVNGKIESFVYLLPGANTSSGEYSRHSSSASSVVLEYASMNAVFGDPCPGKTKRLEVKYTVTEAYKDTDSQILSPSPLPYVPTEIHRVSFAEHETVKLRRYLTTVNTMKSVGDNENFVLDNLGRNDESLESNISWQLQSGTSEIVLPIILPFLSLWERVQCRSICRCWKNIVQECGISRTIDVNSAEMFSRRSDAATATGTSRNGYILTRSLLRGLLVYSYSSLQSLFLNGFGELRKEDLHPTIPYLRNLNVLDISYCVHLDDSTLQLLANPSSPSSTTLRVLYLKSLNKITDIGLVALCNSCSRLEVLDLSHITNITDRGAKSINRLIFLRALFLRDNWQLTNDSIDAITEACSKLEQLTLWGCLRLRHLKFDALNIISNVNTSITTRNRLVILNLWGCHGLEDDVAHVLSNVPNVRCLIVSECHRLSDRFVQILVEGIAQQKRGKGSLHHLHLRYLKKITDAAVVAIALSLRDLYSLDLSFCSKVTATGIYRLLDELRNSLVELRLKNSSRISSQIPGGDERRRNHDRRRNNVNNDNAGHWILNALRRRPHSKIDHSLRLLDVRGCGRQPGNNQPYPDEDSFVKGMSALQFEQKVPGFFSKS